MSTTSRRLETATLALVLLLASAIGLGALLPRARGPGPPVVAAVRILPLVEGLHERAEAKAEIARMEAALTQERTARDQAVQDLEQRLKNAVDPAARRDLQDQLDVRRLENQFWLKLAAGELEVEKAIRLQGLYGRIKQAVAELAQAEGYDLIVLDDSIEEPGFNRDANIPPQLQVLDQISQTKVLYLGPHLDVTDDLITRMNNSFQAGPAAGAPRPGGPAVPAPGRGATP